MMKGTSPDGRHLFPGLSLHVVSARATRGFARPVRSSQDAAGGAGPVEAARPAVPVQHPPHARWLEAAVPRRRDVQAGSCQGCDVESWRLSGQRAFALRRMPFAAQSARRHRRRPALCRRSGAGWRGLGAEHHAEGLEELEVEQIEKLLETGDLPDGDTVGGEMGKVVGNTSSSARRTGARLRPTSSRCRRSTGRSSLKRSECRRRDSRLVKHDGGPSSRPSRSSSSPRCCLRCSPRSCAIAARLGCRSVRQCSFAAPSRSCRWC